MYYEEKIINGALYWRNDPDNEFKPYTLEELSQRYQSNEKRYNATWHEVEAVKDVLKRIILLDEECKDPEYASDNMSIILIIRDIAKVAKKFF